MFKLKNNKSKLMYYLNMFKAVMVYQCFHGQAKVHLAHYLLSIFYMSKQKHTEQSQKCHSSTFKKSSKIGKDQKTFDIYFIILFGCHFQGLIFGREIGHQAVSASKFEIFLIFHILGFVATHEVALIPSLLYWIQQITPVLKCCCKTL